MSASADPRRKRIPVVGSLPGASYVNERLNAAVGLLSALPDVAATLRAIEGHLEHVDSEVSLMRQGVDRLATEVRELRGDIDELGTGINEVSASVGRLEPHVADLSRLTRPLRRRRRSDDNLEAPAPAILPLPGAQPEDTRS